MKALSWTLLALFVVVAVAIQPPNFRFAEKRKRRNVVPNPAPGAELDCAVFAPAPGVAMGNWQDPLNAMVNAAAAGDEMRVKYAAGAGGAAGKWTYTAIAYNNVNGLAQGAGNPVAGIAYRDMDLCKLFPQTICSQAKTAGVPAWPGNNFCGAAGGGGRATCCPLTAFPGAGGPPSQTTFAQAATAAAAGVIVAQAGCPGGSFVAGMPRSFMPQILIDNRVAAPGVVPNPLVGVNRLTAYINAKRAAAGQPAMGALVNAVVGMNIVVPTQDEMFLSNSIRKICQGIQTGGSAGFAPPGGAWQASPLDVCGLGLDTPGMHNILDGHHRYSQKALCPQAKGAVAGVGKACGYHANDPAQHGPMNPWAAPAPGAPAPVGGAANAAANIYVRIWPVACSDIVAWTIQTLDYTNGVVIAGDMLHGNAPAPGVGGAVTSAQLDTAAGTGWTPEGTYMAGGVATGSGVYFKGGAFVELEAKFGRSAHRSEAMAAVAYVNETREKLADMGLELKGGDEALHAYWNLKHRPSLWK